ncbi:MAG: hypothetical protein QOG55_2586 [Acidobacteriaceae bacterium]|jgi:hypothetical protein|nr:hypothetical protein [Acidobacteriaceae bacterium]
MKEMHDLQSPIETRQIGTATVQLPAPTAWPIVLAFGVTLVFAGLLTSASVTLLGAVLAVAGVIGWFRDVLPHEAHETVLVSDKVEPVVTTRPEVARVGWITDEVNRSWLPLEIYPVSAGIKGGLAGSVVMAILAIIYGIASKHGIWYPINLLAAGFFPTRVTTAGIAAFHWDSFLIAVAVHLITSLVVGLLYGAMLPMFPRRPILLGGFVGPILWSGLLYSTLGIVNPVLNQRIDWFWFVLSQLGFGIVAGIVVSRQERIHTWQHLPFALRAGMETTGAADNKNAEDRRP